MTACVFCRGACTCRRFSLLKCPCGFIGAPDSTHDCEQERLRLENLRDAAGRGRPVRDENIRADGLWDQMLEDEEPT